MLNTTVLLIAVLTVGSVDCFVFHDTRSMVSFPRSSLAIAQCPLRETGRRSILGKNLRMGTDDQQDTLKSLQEKKTQLLKEKEDLLQLRNSIIREQQMPQQPKEQAKPDSTAKRVMMESTESISSILDSGSKLPSNEASSGRRNFLRNLALGVTLTFSSLALLLWISGPSIERAAYLQLCFLFEEGSIYFVNKIQQEIKAGEWRNLAEQTEDGGELDIKLFQPILFWATGNSGDPNVDFAAGLQSTAAAYKAATVKLHAAALARDGAAAQAAWEEARSAVNDFVHVVNTRAPADLPPLSEI